MSYKHSCLVDACSDTVAELEHETTQLYEKKSVLYPTHLEYIVNVWIKGGWGNRPQYLLTQSILQWCSNIKINIRCLLLTHRQTTNSLKINIY